jgi:hypothetical protein
MNSALGARLREGGDRLDGLRLYGLRLDELRLDEAYALLNEGKVNAALCIVNTLHISLSLETEVLRFYN